MNPLFLATALVSMSQLASADPFSEAQFARTTDPALIAFKVCNDKQGDLGALRTNFNSMGWIEKNTLSDHLDFQRHSRYLGFRAAFAHGIYTEENPKRWTEDTIKSTIPSTMFKDFVGLNSLIEEEANMFSNAYDWALSSGAWDEEFGIFISPDGMSRINVSYSNCSFLGKKKQNPMLVQAFHDQNPWTKDRTGHNMGFFFLPKTKVKISLLSDQAASTDARLPTNFDVSYSISQVIK